MDSRIQTILRDLYEIDPSFKAHEKKIVLLVEELIKSKPDTKFDENFAARLRSDLVKNYPKTLPSPYMSVLSNFGWRYLAVGGALALLLAVPTTYYGTRYSLNNVSTGFSTEQQIDGKGSMAFGELGVIGGQAPGMGGMPSNDSAISSRQGTAPAMGMSASGADAMNSKMMIYPQHITQYVYKGGPITIADTEAKVYKRIKNANSSKELASLLTGANFGLVNLNDFTNLQARNIELIEDKDFGYVVNINFNEGMIAINSNYERWEQPTEYKPIPLSEKPSNETLIALSNGFLSSKGINRSSFGAPIVQDMPHYIMYAERTGKQEEYSPESMNIIYPLVIDGMEVVEEGGVPHGLTVTIDVRTKRVTSVYNLTTQSFESATYTVENDSKILIDRATRGNSHIMYPADMQAKVTTAELQSPKRVLMRHWSYDQKGMSTELYVPALSFPVTNAPKNGYGQQSILIPIVKTLVDQSQESPASVQPVETSAEINTLIQQ